MAIKFEKIIPGMDLWDVRKNTGFTNNKWNTWPVHVLEVDTKARSVLASWNGNKPQTMYERQVTKYRAKRPEQKKRW